jgi:hypothetical protein
MAVARPKSDSVFIVDLGELKLPAASLDRIAQSVQKAVLLELATIDVAPDFAVQMSRPKGKFLDLIEGLGRTRGMVFTAARE